MNRKPTGLKLDFSLAMYNLDLLLLFALAASPDAIPAQPVDYTRDIKPIFTKHCISCHGPEKQRSGLRLDSAMLIRKGGNAGPGLVPAKSDQSKIIHALLGLEDAKQMPPKGPRLTKAEIDLIRAWIDQGAQAPAREAMAEASSRPKHWSLVPPQKQMPPAVNQVAWVRNPIDRFILARLEREGIAPSPEASRATLIRRLSFDLLGLPPTPSEIEAFVNDSRPDAYERLVDRLLNSPHYGERWGRHWLDQARYADSHGYSIDAPRSIWKYRDWVIGSLNRDLSFDQFTIQQVAGDLLPRATPETRIATGFHRNTQINMEGGINVEQFRIDSIVDRVNTIGVVYLGLTLGCCQCHDHKFDPISQREYYRFFAFLNNMDEPALDLASPEQKARSNRIHQQIATLEKQQKMLENYSAAIEDRWERKLTLEERGRLPTNIKHIIDIPENGRTPKQKETLTAYYRQLDLTRHALGGLASPNALLPLAHLELARFRTSVDRRIAQLKRSEPQIDTTMVVQERKTPRETHVLLGGDFTRPGTQVEPGVPQVLHSLKSDHANRLDLAQWLVDRRNPLTARVTVNRIWQQYFGLGLVETENDFGTQGIPPSHPELLDWLATEFMDRQWSMKAMHRLIATSATYRQSSRSRPELKVVDPRNRLLARQSRLRLEAEVIRDAALQASGLLTAKIGGPSVHPPQPDGVYRFTQVPREWKTNDDGDRFRRGMYTFFFRSAPYPALIVFDSPDANTTCTRRNRSNTPLQALTLLNDEAFFELAQGLADRILHCSNQDDASRLREAYLMALGRGASPIEQERFLALLHADPGQSPRERWTAVARVLLNLDEFITRE